MVIILRSYKNSQRQQELLPTKKEFKSTAVLSYIQGVSEVLRPCLQHQGIRTVFKYDTALRSHLVRRKDALEPTKQNGVVFKIPCECGKVYIGETGISVQKSIKKKYDRDIRFARTQTSAVSEHTNVTKRGLFLFGTRLTLLIVTLTGTHVRSPRLFISDFISTTSIEIAESKSRSLDTHDQTTDSSRSIQIYKGTTSNNRNNNENRNVPTAANQRATNSDT